jgi:rRNA maturation RNase YbeY
VVKNLHIHLSGIATIKKRGVHLIVSYLKKELNFNIFSVSVNFINSKEIMEINSDYLEHHCSTDIITFNYSGDNKDLDGELFISLEDAGNNAVIFGVKFEEEIKRLIIHGFLHLLGYDDKNVKDKKRMFDLQENLLNNCKFAL